MISRRFAIAASAFAFAALSALPAAAVDRKPFDGKAFDAAQASGGPVIVEVHAPWCPVCSRQKDSVKFFEDKADFKNVKIFTVDFDSQKDILKRFNVSKQSTYVVFKGKAEKTRSTGVSDPAEMEKMYRTAL